jgi:hypothetical protein
MATRAETFRAGSARTGGGKKTSVKKPKKGAWSHDKAHAGRKATHALEVSQGRPSRESTRGSANRSKADAAMNITEEVRKGAPTAVARRSQVSTTRVRGRSR